MARLRRTNGSTTMSWPTTSITSSSSSTTTSPRPPILLLAIYPSILLIGSLFSILEPHARAAPYSAVSQSHPPEAAPSYFARKSNILNQYFVKILWVWITAAFSLFLLLHPLTGKPLSDGLALSRRRIQAVLRYAVVTGLWIVTTQWFFGPPLIDRGFRLTGGKCEAIEQGDGRVDSLEEAVTAAACKLAGGRWFGGHDISGHVFILILGSAFLVFESWPVLETIATRGWSVMEERRQEEAEKQRDGAFVLGREGEEREWGTSMAVIAGVVGLALWMLLMTATYFHTWFEKLTGLIVALFGIGIVYILPTIVPAMQAVLGRPGA